MDTFDFSSIIHEKIGSERRCNINNFNRITNENNDMIM